MLTGAKLEEYNELCERCVTANGKRKPGSTKVDWERLQELNEELADPEPGEEPIAPEPGAPHEGASLAEAPDEPAPTVMEPDDRVIDWKIGSPVPEGYRAVVLNIGDKRVGRAYRV